MLQEYSQRSTHQTPVYRSKNWPDHDKQFTVSVSVGEVVLATAVGRSKKQVSEQLQGRIDAIRSRRRPIEPLRIGVRRRRACLSRSIVWRYRISQSLVPSSRFLMCRRTSSSSSSALSCLRITGAIAARSWLSSPKTSSTCCVCRSVSTHRLARSPLHPRKAQTFYGRRAGV